MQSRLLNNIHTLLAGAHRQLQNIQGGGEIVHQGEGFGSLANDTEIKADRLIGEWALGEIMSWKLDEGQAIGRITIEGFEDQPLSLPNGLWVCVDPLDGSLNYRLKGRHNTPFPHSFVVTVLNSCLNPTFQNIIAAGLIDLRPGRDLWLAERQPNGQFLTMFNGSLAEPLQHTKLDLGQMTLLGESYYLENRGILYHALKTQKGYLRSVGSAALEMAYVSSGAAAGFVCHSQKQHELGAAYAFAKGCGAWIGNFHERPLDEVPFQFNTQTPVIVACTPALGSQLAKIMTQGYVEYHNEQQANKRHHF
jgi:fructose-1,6-bisphosphatase/inositol monophosphatase family enzyme